MTDRTDALLAELVELQKRQIANQESMMARQAEAVVRQQEALGRQRKFNRSMWIFIAVIIAMILVVPLLNLVGRTGR